MDPIMLFLKEDIFPKGKSEVDKVRRTAPRFGCPRTKSCTNALSLGYICYVYTLRHQSYSWSGYMKGFVAATQEAGHYLTNLSLKDTGGRTCRMKRKSM